MYPVYLLEDDFKQQEEYSSIIKNAIKKNKCDMQLVCRTMSPLELISMAQAQEGNDGLFFLDMEIGDNRQAGLQTAIQIRELLPFSQIVFITVHEELAFLTLENRVAPMDYVIKDQDSNQVAKKISENIVRVSAMFQKSDYNHPKMFTYRVGQRYHSLPLDDIMFFSTNKTLRGHVLWHTADQEAEFLGSLTELNHRYQNQNFFRCDRSYLVNLNQKCSFDNETRKISFADGSEAYVASRKVHEFLQRFQ
ncbi:response regulator transcription factor [Bombilactobacillus thymidiniphilus]|uniref:Response regulator transcription factor n=1 Tax=Bombilactobacillus thymidiniphilus TaxID=2923363 RepID=A0ABY4PCT7_9LACO|nr:response regulator transcription factor [Bombilactobacillus thymidiniphilus]UQS83400.1 response regulator transcription factor [Bombilactobacillus thymidiniphilus]